MVRKFPSPIAGHVRIVFELPADIWADRVAVTGDFNQWDEAGIPMSPTRDGTWQATVDLPIGSRHEFRYLIDGEWRTDYHADGYAENIHGTQNSVVVAELPESSPAPRLPAVLESAGVTAGDSNREALEKWLARRKELVAAA